MVDNAGMYMLGIFMEVEKVDSMALTPLTANQMDMISSLKL